MSAYREPGAPGLEQRIERPLSPYRARCDACGEAAMGYSNIGIRATTCVGDECPEKRQHLHWRCLSCGARWASAWRHVGSPPSPEPKATPRTARVRERRQWARFWSGAIFGTAIGAGIVLVVDLVLR